MTRWRPSNHSDQHTTVAVVDRLAANGIKPEVLYGDGNFVSGENIIACAERGVNLQGNLTGSDSHPEKLKLADFTFAEDGTTIITFVYSDRTYKFFDDFLRKPHRLNPADIFISWA